MENKPRYDISMSRRTRKSPLQPHESHHNHGDSPVTYMKSSDDEKKRSTLNEEKKAISQVGPHKERGSIGRHLNEKEGEEMKLLNLVVTSGAVKRKGMVSRCVKLLNSLVKVKPKSKKSLLQLTM